VFSLKIALLSLMVVLLLPAFAWGNGLEFLPLYFLVYPVSILFTVFVKIVLLRTLGSDWKLPTRIGASGFIVLYETILLFCSYQIGLRIALLEIFEPVQRLAIVGSSCGIFLLFGWPLNIGLMRLARNVARTRYREALALAAIFPTTFYCLTLLIYNRDFPPERSAWWGYEMIERQKGKQPPQSADDYFDRGRRNFAAGRTAEAIPDFTRSLDLRPKEAYMSASMHAATYAYRADAYLKDRQWDLAIADFTKALELKPEHMGNLFMRAQAYYQKGQHDAAIADLDGYLKYDPQDNRAFYLRGQIYKQNGNLDQSISDFTAGLTGPWRQKRVDCLHARAEAYFLKNDDRKAWADVHEAEKLGHPVSAEFLLKLRQRSGRDQ
jgi:tetratricopeptide (TPR) repeat protein